MTSPEKISQSNPLDKPFSHSGITYNHKTREVTFSPEAKEELRKFIIELQEGIQPEQKREPIVELTNEVGQAVVDAMISEGKWKQKVKKFLKLFTKAIEKPEEMSKKEEKKVMQKVEKFTHVPCIHIHIVLEDGHKIPAPFIVRKGETLDDIIKQFVLRFNMPIPLNTLSK
ncbi:hypothetical protein KBD33_05745 [Candidatus Gracilibacteria bacterium]|nr:hypothetical protein [Candidatus Gracilibacteria bacterium]